jgi:fluoride exporter
MRTFSVVLYSPFFNHYLGRICMQTLNIAFWGALGVLSRHFIDRLFSQTNLPEFPLSTFIINCIGSFLIGILFVTCKETGLVSKELSTALTVGFLGGFTTFSAFSIQTFQLLERGKFGIAAGYFLGSPVLGLICAIGGFYLARTFWIQ